MRMTQFRWLFLVIIGVPALLVLVMLWPRIQDRLEEARLEEARRQVPADRITEQREGDASGTTEEFRQGRAGDKTGPVPVPPIAVEQPSAVETLVTANREKLDGARASYDRVARSADTDLLKRYGREQWSEIQTVVSLAQRLPDPLVAAEKYRAAETQLRELIADLPVRQLLSELDVLRSQQEHLTVLTRLSTAQESQPAFRDRLAPYWSDVSRWETETWLAVIRRECEELSPDDGGFADVYLALADFHHDQGNEQAAKDAEQVAWEHALRMTHPTRAAQSALRSLQRLSAGTPASVRADRFETATTLVRDISDPSDHMELLAALARLANASQAAKFLNEIQGISQSSRLDLRLYWPAIYRCQVLAETRPPSGVFDVCVSIPKYNGSIGFDPFAANAMAYASAATAAARTGQQSEFWKGLLLGEAQQLDDTGVELRSQRACAALAAADLRQQNYRRVVISAMNLLEPELRPPLLFPVMIESSQDVPVEVASRLVQRHGDADLGCMAVAKYLPTLVSDFESDPDAISLILKLPVNSVRIAALIGWARHQTQPPETVQPPQTTPAQVDLTDSRTLLEIAASEAALLQMPLDRAWAAVWIAACWKTRNQPASYAQALTAADDALFQAWEDHWDSLRAGDSAAGYRNQRERDRELRRLIDFSATLAELQAFVLNDPQRAIENVINAARASQPLNHGNTYLKMRLWIIVESIHRECDLPPGTLDSAFIPPSNFHRLLLASRNQDAEALSRIMNRVESEGMGRGYEGPDYLARGHAEVARLAAMRGDLETYRSARRKAVGLIRNDSLYLPLHEADANAGEFALAIKRKRNLTPLILYGTSGRTTSVLCRQLSLASRTEEALGQLPATSDPFHRLQAMHAIAANRSRSIPSEQLVRWLEERTEPLDRVAILCGLACQQPIP